jgi:O-antigen/teichoic acid export membrane protein
MSDTASQLRTPAADGGRTIAANALAGGAGWIALAGLRFIAKVVLIRALAPADLGRVVTTQYVLGLAIMVAAAGVGDAVVRFAGGGSDSGRPATAVVFTAGRFVLLTGLAATGLLIAVGPTLAVWLGLGPAGPYAVALAALAIVPTLLGATVGAAFSGVNRTWVKVLAFDGAGAAITLAGYLVIASVGVASYLAAVSVHVFAALLSAACVIAVFHYRGHASAESHASLRSLLRYGVPLFFATLIADTLVASGIPLILAARHAPESVAIYTMAITLGSLVYVATSAIENAAVPVWAAMHRASGTPHLMRSFAGATRWGLIVGLLVFVPLASTPREWIQLLFGTQYAGATAPVAVILTVILFAIAVGPYEGMLRALDDTGALLRARTIAAVAAVAALWPLVDAWGVFGASLAWAVSEVLGAVAAAAYLVRRHGIHPLDARYLRTAGVGIISWLACITISAGDMVGSTKLLTVGLANTAVVTAVGFAAGIWHPSEIAGLLRRPLAVA